MMFQQPIDAVIIGAGAAGLFAADRLNRAGLSFLILEADDRAGGRVQSRREIGTDLGLVLDEGANLINSTDTLAIGLLNRFDVPYVRRLPRGVDHMHYLLDGLIRDTFGPHLRSKVMRLHIFATWKHYVLFPKMRHVTSSI